VKGKKEAKGRKEGRKGEQWVNSAMEGGLTSKTRFDGCIHTYMYIYIYIYIYMNVGNGGGIDIGDNV
jgi:hypothetical protein